MSAFAKAIPCTYLAGMGAERGCGRVHVPFSRQQSARHRLLPILATLLRVHRKETVVRDDKLAYNKQAGLQGTRILEALT